MKSILFDGRETSDSRCRGFTHFAEKRGTKYWHPRVIQLVNYAWGENDCPPMRVNNKCVSKKKRYFYSFPSCSPAIFAQLRWVLRKNCLSDIGESVKASYFLEFRSCMATYVQPENYRLRKEESVLYSRLRNEVRSSLRATLCGAFQFLRVFQSVKNVLLELYNICARQIDILKPVT